MSLACHVTVQRGDFILDVALDFAPGITALIGDNGAGKSTLLRTLAGAHRPQRGRIVLDDAVFYADDGAWRPPEERGVGFVPQSLGLFSGRSARDNVMFGLTGAERERRAQRALRTLGAAAVAGRRVEALSGGERQRVALARALAAEPALLLLDEPLAAIDVRGRVALRKKLREMVESTSRPLVFATHDANNVTAMADHVVVLDGGAVVQSGALDDVRGAPANDFITAFFAEAASI